MMAVGPGPFVRLERGGSARALPVDSLDFGGKRGRRFLQELRRKCRAYSQWERYDSPPASDAHLANVGTAGRVGIHTDMDLREHHDGQDSKNP